MSRLAKRVRLHLDRVAMILSIGGLLLSVGLWVRSAQRSDDCGLRIGASGGVSSVWAVREYHALTRPGGITLAYTFACARFEDVPDPLPQGLFWTATEDEVGWELEPDRFAGFVCAAYGPYPKVGPEVRRMDYVVGFPFWFSGGVALIFPTVRAIRRHRPRRRLMQGRCVNCGYDLRASRGRCPECGASC